MKTVCFPPNPTPENCQSALCACEEPAHRQPARAYPGGVVCAQRAIPRPGQALRAARPLCLPHALQPGHLPGRSRDRRSRRSRTRARSGASLPATTISFAERPRACGWTLPFRSSSDWRSGSRRRPPTSTSTPSPKSCSTPEFLPRALYERFNLEVLATTDSPLDSLADHQAIRDSGWKARILPTFRPDPVVDPEFAGFRWKHCAQLGEQTGEDTATWAGYLNASAQGACPLQGARLHCDRPRPSHRANRRLCRWPRPPNSSTRCSPAQADRSAAGALPRADAHRDGADEPRRRPGHADSSRQRAQPQPPRSMSATAATWAATFPRPPTTWTRFARCSTASATSASLTHHPLHARRIHLQPRTGSAGRPLSLPAPWPAVVVSRQPGGHDALPRTGDRDGGLL